MAPLAKIIIVLLAITHFFGQLVRLNFFSISIPPLDILLVLLVIVNLIHHFKQHTSITNKPFLYFIFFSWLTYLANLIHQPLSLISALYLLRLNCLLSLFIWPLKPEFFKPKIKYLIFLTLLANVIFGLVQYCLWPDFTYFSSQQWDPHLYRLVSTFFDPTFTGLIYLIFIIYLYLTSHIYYLIPLVYFALALTYSRSTLLALLVVSFFLSQRLKQPKIVFLSLIVLLLTLLALPRLPGEGTKLERTSSIKAKIENYHQGLALFATSPIIGHGYNNLFFVKDVTNPNSHTNSGFDGSLVTILTTTGLIGFGLFTIGLIIFFRQASLFQQASLVAILVHSLFANSLLYPWVILLLFVL